MPALCFPVDKTAFAPIPCISLDPSDHFIVHVWPFFFLCHIYYAQTRVILTEFYYLEARHYYLAKANCSKELTVSRVSSYFVAQDISIILLVYYEETRDTTSLKRILNVTRTYFQAIKTSGHFLFLCNYWLYIKRDDMPRGCSS